jgi:hypothetical protein
LGEYNILVFFGQTYALGPQPIVSIYGKKKHVDLTDQFFLGYGELEELRVR